MSLPGSVVIAVVPVRDGVAPLGADETVAEAGGAAVLIGSSARAAVPELPALTEAWCAEVGDFEPGRWASALAAVLAGTDRVLLPASPDGRDLAPRLAAVLGRPLLAGCQQIWSDRVEVIRWGGRVSTVVHPLGPFVATLQPGIRGSVPSGRAAAVHDLSIERGVGLEATVLEVLPPDPATADLAEAPRILGAGAGLAKGELEPAAAVSLLGEVAAALQASLGATRVVTDAGWTGYERQIGTTGVVVDPDLYVAFGVSGAAQHVGGLGAPKHTVSVNLDASCPMTAMADLGIVADAQELLKELAGRLLPRDEVSRGEQSA